MKYGLIGMPLGHSWSPEIHDLLIHEPYEKKELKEEELADFLKKREFSGINVTIPYKQAVIPYLDEMDDQAERIGAVNCIVNHNGVLKGYNTDCIGFSDMMKANRMPVGRCAVLGSGGASKAVKTALEDLGAEPVIVSRHPSGPQISYDELYERESGFVLLVNATPVGMYPHIDQVPADLSRFTGLQGVVDIIANPLRTRLQFDAQCRHIRYLGGFEMLVRQAAAADELFTGQKVSEAAVQHCMHVLYEKRRSIILIGMPTSGKTSIGSVLAERSGRRFIDMDEELVKRLGMPISDCFEKYGEAYFRREESRLAEELSTGGNLVVSTGGGIIKNRDNMRCLSASGLVVWIRRKMEDLFPSADRPLSSSREAVRKLYEERKDLYALYSDMTIENNGTVEEAAEKIMHMTGEEK